MKHSALLFLLLLLGLASAALLSGQSRDTGVILVAQLGGAGYEQLSLIKSQDQLYSVLIGSTNGEGIEQQLLAVIKKQELRVARVMVFESKETARLGSGLRDTEMSYRRWALARTEIDRQCLPVLDVIKINGNAVSRRISADCQKSEHLLLGTKNPLFFDLSGTKYVIHDYEPHIFRYKALPGREEPGAEWHVRTEGKVDTDTALLVFGEVQKWAPAPNITLVLRNDPWFLLPVFSPFVSEAMPTRTEYTSSPQATCVLLSGYPVHCWLDNTD